MRWAEIEARLEADVQQVFAERMAIEPMRRGDFTGATLDPGRPILDLSAMLEIPRAYAAEIAGVGHLRVAYSEARLEIERAALPEDWDIRTGDLVTAMDRPGRPRWSVSRVDDEPLAHLSLILSPLQGAAA